ncbi:MAG: ThiF family adenylyltransferase, partial [Candidatus Heimdallarchaeota archaeon]|nr:ThiF family adenylyltransferase [Candidatus Heimdallarchaeota archaeon]
MKGQTGTYSLYGRIYDDFTICHLTSIDISDGSDQLIGILAISEENTKETLNYPYLHSYLNSENIKDLRISIHHNRDEIISNIPLSIELVNLQRLFVRIDQNETPLEVLKTKKVVIIGMGSGGSLVAVYLAKSGLKNFIFLDDDKLETHNIIRHICDLSQLGRYKTHAVKEFIEKRIPDVNIKTIERKFEVHTKAHSDEFLTVFKGVDLIIAVSGEHTVNYSINDFVHTNNLPIPIIFAGTFDGVKGGLMFKVDPRKDDYCYHCIYSDPIDDSSTGSLPTTSELEKQITYDRTLQEQIAQPGLGLDIDNLTILLSKFSLDILLQENEHALYHFNQNFYMWFNRTIMKNDGESVKFEGLELCYYDDLVKDPRCPFHGNKVEKLSETDE